MNRKMVVVTADNLLVWNDYDYVKICAVVSKVPGLTQYEMFKIIDKLMQGGAEDFKFLKTLPDDEKMGWIQFKLDPN